MIRTYIYGIPHGFNFFENDVEYLEYFKAFYISSRRGRRMVVNRRENGDTIYSYLQYGMREVERQPLHAFFGMSIVLGNYEYCSDFKTLLGWFDTIFEKFVKEHGIITVDSEGNYRYQVHKFEEKLDDVNWLKSNLPNIFTKSDKISLQKYDDTFVDGCTGQVAGYKQSVSNEQILAALKKYRWVSITSEITDKPSIVNSNGSENIQPTIELNYKELNDKLNELNKESLSIAVDKKKGSIDILNRIADEVRRNTKSIYDYLHSTLDNQEIERFNELGNNYVTLRDQIKALSASYTGQSHKPVEETKQCLSCKLYKPLSEFASSNASECKSCESRHKPPKVVTRTCKVCHKKKPLAEFSSTGAVICKECEQHMNFDWRKWLPKILISLGGVVVIVAAIVFLPKACTSEVVSKPTDSCGTIVPDDKSSIDINELNRLLAVQQYEELFSYIKDKRDNHQYDKQIRDSIEHFLWNKIDDARTHADTYLASFWIENTNILNHIGFSDQKNYWEELNKDYQTLRAYAQKDSLTQTDYDNALRIANKYPIIPSEWKNIVEQKWKKKKTNARQDEPKKDASNGDVSTSKGYYTITYIKSNGSSETVEITRRMSVTAKKGSQFIVRAPEGKKILDNKKSTLTEYANQKKVIHCDSNIDVTVEVIKFNEL